MVQMTGLAQGFTLPLQITDDNHEEGMLDLHKNYQIDGTGPNFLASYGLGLAGLALTYVICFDPFGVLHNYVANFYQGNHLTSFVILVAVQAFATGKKLLRGEIVRVAIKHDQISFEFANVFNDHAGTLNLSAEQLYCFKNIQAQQPITLITQQGELKLNAALQQTDLITDLNQQLFLNLDYYQQLNESQLYDIFNALDSGPQRELIHQLLNQLSEQKNQDYVTQMLTPKPSIGLTAQQTPHMAAVDQCKNCLSPRVIEGIARSAQPVFFTGKNFNYSFWGDYASNNPLPLKQLWACVDCGFCWTQFESKRLKNHLNAHADDATLAKLK